MRNLYHAMRKISQSLCSFEMTVLGLVMRHHINGNRDCQNEDVVLTFSDLHTVSVGEREPLLGHSRDLPNNGRSVGQLRGTSLRRITYHYWYHLGEIMSIRQMIGGEHLPDFVGNIDSEAPYRPE